jgi:hypothetical protein
MGFFVLRKGWAPDQRGLSALFVAVFTRGALLVRAGDCDGWVMYVCMLLRSVQIGK